MTFQKYTTRSAMRNMRHIARERVDGLAGEVTVDDLLWRVDWRKRQLPYCGIYVITPDSLHPSKIGISTAPMTRLISLQTSHWRMLQVSEYRWAASVQDAERVEKEAHRILHDNDKALLGEWFDVRASAALEAIQWAALSLGIEIRSDAPTDQIAQDIARWKAAIDMREHEVKHDNMRRSFDAPALGFKDAEKSKYGVGHLFAAREGM